MAKKKLNSKALRTYLCLMVPLGIGIVVGGKLNDYEGLLGFIGLVIAVLCAGAAGWFHRAMWEIKAGFWPVHTKD